MSDWFQTFVVEDALDAAACHALVARVVGALVARGVVLPEHAGEHRAGPAHESIASWPADHPVGLGYVAFELWGFTQLSDAFVDELTALIGHRVVLVRGKL